MRTQFPSRVDAWLVALLAGVPLLLIGLGVLALSKSTGAGLVQMGVGLAVGVAIAACSIPCRYTLDASRLRIHLYLAHAKPGSPSLMTRCFGVGRPNQGETALKHFI